MLKNVSDSFLNKTPIVELVSCSLATNVEDIPEEQQEVIKRNYAAQQALRGRSCECSPWSDPSVWCSTELTVPANCNCSAWINMVTS